MANPSADFVLGLTSYRAGRAQEFEGLNLLQEHATKVDGVFCPVTLVKTHPSLHRSDGSMGRVLHIEKLDVLSLMPT